MKKLEIENWNEVSRILSGEASADEMKVFFDELEGNSAKREAFDVIRSDWEAANNAMIYKGLDEDKAWAKQQAAIQSSSEDEQTTIIQWPVILKWAAVLILGLGLGYYFYAYNTGIEDGMVAVKTGTGETETVLLSDGSEITLNENSYLEYSNANNRQVNFGGEAYFDIASDPSNPFIISMNDTYVKVLGTSFNITTSKESTQVYVTEGTVELGKSDESSKLLLEAGTSGIITARDISKNSNPSVNIAAWHTKLLVFQDVLLSDVLKDLEKAYYVRFNIEESSIQNCRLTSDFTDDELTTVLSTIQVIFNVQFIDEGNSTYSVNGLGCK